MFVEKKSVCIIGFVAILGACAQPEPEPIAPEPIYNKYGEATGCRSADGQITGINSNYAGRENPCVPEDCVDGYIAGTQTPCVPTYRDPQDGDRPTGNVTGAVN